VHQAIREKTQKEIVLLYDNACPYILWQIWQGDTGKNELGNHERPFLQPSLNPQWFPFVWTNEGAFGGQIFQIYDKLKNDVLTWLRSQDKNSKAGDVSNLPGQWGGGNMLP
jgi:hypothetical protein